MPSNISVDVERVEADIAALAALTEPGRPWTRRAFTPLFLAGRAWLRRRLEEAGLAVSIDAGGNMIGRRAGRRPGTGTIMLGSHTDTVPDGGRYDGIAGVIAALEVVRTLHERGIVLDHDIEVVDFLAEEVSIFGASCIGSRAMAGTRPAEWLERRVDGRSLSEAIDEVGGSAAAPLVPREDIRAFLELHIEQGPVLEDAGLDIGLVEAISGISRVEIAVSGRPDHAGTTPMGKRRDALSAAAHVVLWVETEATRLAGIASSHFAATVGEHRIEPNAANVVPSEVRMLIDIRSIERPILDEFLAGLAEACRDVAARTGVEIAEVRPLSDNPATPCDRRLLDVLEASCRKLDLGHLRMSSGAGHDTAWISRIAPAAMIFVPCREGRSHCAEESAEPIEIALGAEVLLETVIAIDKGTGR